MKKISFVSVEELSNPEYRDFSAMEQYDKEHPLRMFFDYIIQFYGGLREDVLKFFCNKTNREHLCKYIGKNPEPAVRNDWYRRLVRLLQCSASAAWYELCCMDMNEKGEGYRQYFMTQLAGYAEQGYSAEEVKMIFLRCNVAYLLEYQIRELREKEDPSECIEESANEITHPMDDKEEFFQDKQNQEYFKMMTEVLEGQKRMQKLLESAFFSMPEECIDEDIRPEATTLLPEPEFEEVNEISTVIEETEETVIQEREEEVVSEIQEESNLEQSFWLANLFQRIRYKRKTVQLRKMDSKQQIQELAILMKNKNFQSEDMRVVRNLIDQDVSMEFLYTIIAEEQEATKQLKQMYEFISYQPAGVTE